MPFQGPQLQGPGWQGKELRPACQETASPEYQRCYELLGSLRVSPCPYYSQGLLRQLQGLHALIPSRTRPPRQKRTSMKAEYTWADTRIGRQTGGWAGGTLAAATQQRGVRRGPTGTAALMTAHRRQRKAEMQGRASRAEGREHAAVQGWAEAPGIISALRAPFQCCLQPRPLAALGEPPSQEQELHGDLP